jgi:hypothetical protein
MDKLKENLYSIAVGLTVVVLLALSWFFVWRPIEELSSEEAALKRWTEDLQDYNRADFVPTAAYRSYLEEKREEKSKDLQEGVEWYEEKLGAFKKYFDGSDQVPQVGGFEAQLTTRLGELQSAYRQQFELPVDFVENPQSPPVVGRRTIDPTRATEDIAGAMKEFWIIEAVFQACGKLGLGGLKKIDFPGRREKDKDAPPYHALILTEVVIDLPYHQLENLMTELFSSERVLLELEGLTVEKNPDLLEQYGKPREVPFDTKVQSDGKSHRDLVVEPNVTGTLTFHAVDWIQLVAEPDEDVGVTKKAGPPKKKKKKK